MSMYIFHKALSWFLSSIKTSLFSFSYKKNSDAGFLA